MLCVCRGRDGERRVKIRVRWEERERDVCYIDVNDELYLRIDSNISLWIYKLIFTNDISNISKYIQSYD